MNISDFCSGFSSATLAGCSNQFFFASPEKADTVAYYRTFFHGNANFSFLFTSTIDSTYDDGSRSRAGDLCGNFEVSDLSVSITAGQGENARARLSLPLTIFGRSAVFVAPGENFATDPVALSVLPGEYLALSMSVKGEKIPCHPENLIPTYRRTANGLVPSKEVYLPSMVGADFPVEYRVGFVGDSITQGIGCPEDSYLHYTAVTAERLAALSEKKFSFWNLGIGFGRGADFAQDGSWAEKAKTCDVVTVCFGVNDLFHVEGGLAAHLSNFEKILKFLKDAGCRVVLQTVPPFDLPPEQERLRCQLNDRLRRIYAGKVDLFFDETPYLSAPDDPKTALYGGHPDPVGSALWGEKLAEAMLGLLRQDANKEEK